MLQATKQSQISERKLRIRESIQKTREKYEAMQPEQTFMEYAHEKVKANALYISGGFLVLIQLVMVYGVIKALS